MLHFLCKAKLYRDWVLACRPPGQYRASQTAYPARRSVQSAATGGLGRTAVSPILYDPAHVQESTVAGPTSSDTHLGRMTVLTSDAWLCCSCLQAEQRSASEGATVTGTA